MNPSKARANEVMRTPKRTIIFIQVTCNVNAKSQTWNENIWTVTRPKKRARV